MNDTVPTSDAELVDRICATTGLPPGTARRLVEDVLAHHAESLEDFVARRHRELAAEGLRNAAIYQRLCEEAQRRVFRVPALSVRQVRRIIYG